jgi:hypothetical protein
MKVAITKEFLTEVYCQQRLSTWAIEKKYGVSRSSVYSSLKKFGISTRTIAGSHIKYDRADFSGDLLEKAYLTGFALGDLRVRRQNKDKSETISIGCGSTKQAQIDLFEILFSKYGRVWKGKADKRGAINVEAFVNVSFEFLLPTDRDYTWTLLNTKHFFAFLAGFTDAEGSFYISGGKAFVAWGNYDQKVLNFIREALTQFGIEVPRMYCDALKGTKGSHGYTRNGTYCHVSLCKKTEIKKLLKCLKPYLRHSDKLQRLALVEENITLRISK